MELKLQYHLDLAPNSRWNMVSATGASKASLLYLQESGDFFAGPEYFTTREGFDSFLIKLTVSGSGTLQYGGSSYAVGAGKFYWIDCRSWHDYRTSPRADGWHVLWVHFYGANARFYYDAFLNNNGGEPVCTLPAVSGAYDAMRSLLELDGADGKQQEMDFRAACLLTQLITECVLAPLQSAAGSAVPQHIHAIQLYLVEHSREKVTLDRLGAAFNLNPFYLQKQFKRYIGQSPTEYLIYLRMTRAKELMRTTRQSIGEIAHAVGIENLSYFTHQFKKQEGLTPQEYRRLWPSIGAT